MSTIKKLTVQELRTLIMESVNEQEEIADAEDQAAEQEGDEDMAAAEADERAANESHHEAVAVSDDVLLERWKKLAGILRD